MDFEKLNMTEAPVNSMICLQDVYKIQYQLFRY